MVCYHLTTKLIGTKGRHRIFVPLCAVVPLLNFAAIMVQLSSPWPHEGQQQRQQQQIESAIRHKLETTGEIDRIHHSLHANLTECGWRNNVLQESAKEMIRRKGLQPITLDSLVAELVPVGRATVPNEVKVKLVEHLKSQCFRDG